jgi:ABC-type nitrate/sulfonate/bicarbonate transport system substrate-binding protein
MSSSDDSDTIIPTCESDRLLARLAYGAGSLTEPIIQYQQQMADAFHTAGLIPKPITIKDIVWSPPS